MRRIIQWLMPGAVVTAGCLGLLLPLPASLPAIALGSAELLRTERSLAFFYGFLLLVVPVLRALQGQLPIELSTRGARWQETTTASERGIAGLSGDIDDLGRQLAITVGVVSELGERLAQLERRQRKVN